MREDVLGGRTAADMRALVYGAVRTNPDSRATAGNAEAGEFRCPECWNRCTRGPSGVEYGHKSGGHGRDVECTRRPECVESTRPTTTETDEERHTKRDGGGRFTKAGSSA